MFEIKRQGDGRVLLMGRLDASQAQRATAFLEGIDESCTLDCSALEYISSAGLGILLQMQKRMTAANCNLRLVGLRENIRDVFRVSGLDQIFLVE